MRCPVSDQRDSWLDTTHGDAEALERLRPRGEMAVTAGDDCDDVQPAHAHRCVVCDAERDEHAEALCSTCAAGVVTALMHRPGCACRDCGVWQRARRHVDDVGALSEVRAAEQDVFNGGPL